ncbi:hypothetical protein F5B22DRAFT_632209 [Xylaria bambusicola]|uniref:uncharacterized protein n=1 Tax=Xylaria bambusicola TaxID=326684 RepID=UPI0020081DE6|nr:uncharacterized protein F5B22DRAFT_632209 [Xylaria bambusicola]KAI0502745.1 hypothetical protein F5B22DRAFT_632209 [Xylaria bambusicola]
MFMCPRSSVLAAWPILLACTGSAVSQSTCTENVTLSTGAEAQSLSERCKILDGSITLPGNLSESINLDGLEEIRGDFTMEFSYSGDSGYSIQYEPYYGPSYEISSSTLQTVGGVVQFGLGSTGLAYPEDYQAPSLGNVSFPSLMNISAGVEIAAPNLTHIDLTSLQYFTFFSLSTPQLAQLQLRHVKGLNDNIHWLNNVGLESIGNVESLDGLFSEPIDQTSSNLLHDDGIWQTVYFGKQPPHHYPNNYPYGTSANGPAPSLRNLTIGWEQLQSTRFTDMNLTLTLGGTMTESMTIKIMVLERGNYKLQRGPAVKHLAVLAFRADNDFDNTDLVLPFDQVDEVYINSTELQSITLPQEAENWTRPIFELHAPKLRLDSSTTWHWPLHMDRLVIEAGTITDDFFESFTQKEIEVRYEVQIVDHSKTLDCSKLYREGDGHPWVFHCEDKYDDLLELQKSLTRDSIPF